MSENEQKNVENEEETTQTSSDALEQEEESEELSPDELMAMQYAQNSYAHNQSHPETEEGKLSILLDIPLEVTVEIGSTEMAIEEILKLNPNSVIELDRYIDEPIDLKVNGKIIAKGELYTVKNNFGIKITQIITPEDRMKLLDM